MATALADGTVDLGSALVESFNEVEAVEVDETEPGPRFDLDAMVDVEEVSSDDPEELDVDSLLDQSLNLDAIEPDELSIPTGNAQDNEEIGETRYHLISLLQYFALEKCKPKFDAFSQNALSYYANFSYQHRLPYDHEPLQFEWHILISG